MIVSLDYDDTYTRDPELWNKIVMLMRDKGHTVYVISARYDRQMDEVHNSIGKIVGIDNCYGTNMQQKREYMYKNHGILIDVWIDDMPEMIVENTNGIILTNKYKQPNQS